MYNLQGNKKKTPLPVIFNNTKVVTCSTQKHLELFLDRRLCFNEHIKSKIYKCCKMIVPIMHCWGFKNRLLGPIWITETLFKTKQIMSHLKAKLKMFGLKAALR